MWNPYQSLPTYMLRNNFTFNPNKWTIDSYKDFNKNLIIGKSQGLWLFENDTNKLGTTTREIILNKDVEKYIKDYEPLAEKYEEYEQNKKSFSGKLNNFFGDVGNKINDVLKDLDLNKIIGASAFLIFLLIIVIKI